jgi:uncharacterized protein
MIVLLSPAKMQDFRKEPPLKNFTQPDFLGEAEKLVHQLRTLSMSTLAGLLGINPHLAQLNAERFARWQRPFNPANAKQTVLVFNGEVFHGLNVRSLAPEHHAYMQDHLRIFSGLYGLLRPLDLIQAYRLDVGDSYKTEEGQNLYQFWTDRITKTLNIELSRQGGTPLLLNLASNEYIKSVNRQKLQARILNMEFMEHQPQGYKTIVVYTKKARGMMARFVLEHHIEEAEDLKGFDSEGYLFNPSLSKENNWVFTR